MSEWLKEHAWKAVGWSSVEMFPNHIFRSRFNDLTPKGTLCVSARK